MQFSMNNVELLGNVTRDIELKIIGNGTPVCKFSIALNKKWFNKEEQEWKEKTTFVNCEAWQKTATQLSEWLTKGSKVLIQGELKVDEWDDKETGAKRREMKVNVFNFTPFTKEKLGNVASQDAHEPQAPVGQPANEDTDVSEDVPFS